MKRASDKESGASHPLVAVHDLRTYFPVRRGLLGNTTEFLRAVDGLGFEIRRGTTLGLVGESGCGKTTLGRTILRLIPRTSGEVLVDGVDVFEASGRELRRLRRTMQMVFQDPLESLDPRMTAGRIVAEPLEIHGGGTGRERHRRVLELLDRVGLRAAHTGSYPHELSGGQRQRVSIARALALEPKFVVCDEPVSALDVSVQAKILNLLSDLQRDYGLTYLFISHNLAVIKHISDRVAVMFKGKIVETAAADDIYRQPAHPYTMTLLSAIPGNHAAGAGGSAESGSEAPGRADLSSGCVFHGRCRFATDECRHVAPRLQAHPGLPADHAVACHEVENLLAEALVI